LLNSNKLDDDGDIAIDKEDGSSSSSDSDDTDENLYYNFSSSDEEAKKDNSDCNSDRMEDNGSITTKDETVNGKGKGNKNRKKNNNKKRPMIIDITKNDN
jgi:hypothetical protein